MSTKDRKAIIQIAKGLMDARNRRDSRKFASFFASDAQFTNVKGKRTNGKKALEESIRSFYATAFVRRTRQVIENTNILFVRPNVASLEVRWRTEGALDLAGNPRRGLINALLTKDVEIWKVRVSHNAELIEGVSAKVAKISS